jgi:hypothetical protein
MSFGQWPRLGRVRRERWLLQGLGPLVLALGVAGVLIWGILEIHQRSSQPDPLVSFSAAVRMFAGEAPEVDEAQPLLTVITGLAFLLTLVGAVATATYALSQSFRDFVRTFWMRPDLVVVGDGHTAAAIVKSSIEHRDSSDESRAAKATILLTANRQTEAAVAARSAGLVIESGRQFNFAAKHIIKKTQHVVAAFDDDTENLEIHKDISGIGWSPGVFPPKRRRALVRRILLGVQNLRDSPTTTTRQDPLRKNLIVIRDPELAHFLRPEVIDGELPRHEVTCPNDNIAEHICHLIVAAATGRAIALGRKALDVAVTIETSTPSDELEATHAALADTIRLWVTRLQHSMGFLNGKEITDDGEDGHRYAPVPRITRVAHRIVTADQSPDAGDDIAATDSSQLAIRILLGGPAARLLQSALDAEKSGGALHDEESPGFLTIVVANQHVVREAKKLRTRSNKTEQDAEVLSGKEWLSRRAPREESLVVVDPEGVGLDAALVTDDVGTQWARTFDLSYNLMYFDGGWSVTAWQPGQPMGESTRMLERLEKRNPRMPWSLATWVRREERRTRKHELQKRALNARKPIANRYSSARAVEHMLTQLADRGLVLKHHKDYGKPCDSRPLLTLFENLIAQLEHENWTTRPWWDTSRFWAPEHSVRETSNSRAYLFNFAELEDLGKQLCSGDDGQKRAASALIRKRLEQDKLLPGKDRANLDETVKSVAKALRFAANYNRRIATEAYPAIAASMGYEIVPPTAPGRSTT